MNPGLSLVALVFLLVGNPLLAGSFLVAAAVVGCRESA